MTFWRWVALALALALGTVYGLGKRLPEAHRAVAEGVVQAPQARVWKLMDDTATQTQWRTHLLFVKPMPDSDGQHCWYETHRSMGLVFCRVEEIPQSRLVVRIADATTLGGTWTYTLSPEGENATRVNIVEEGFVKNPIWRFLGHYVMGEQTSARQFVTDLQAEVLRKR